MTLCQKIPPSDYYYKVLTLEPPSKSKHYYTIMSWVSNSATGFPTSRSKCINSEVRAEFSSIHTDRTVQINAHLLAIQLCT